MRPDRSDRLWRPFDSLGTYFKNLSGIANDKFNGRELLNKFGIHKEIDQCIPDTELFIAEYCAM